MRIVKLGDVLKHRKEFVQISDDQSYKLCRVQTNRKGVLLREIKMGALIQTKKQQVCKKNDFIVAEMDAKVGGYGFIPEDLDGSIVSSHYFLFDVDFGKIRKEYLEAIIQTEIIQEQIKAKGSTNYSAIRPKDILNWEIPLATLEEQKEIEKNFLKIREASIKLLIEIESQKSLLSQFKQSTLQEAIHGKLTSEWRDQRKAEKSPLESASELLRRIQTEKAKLIKEKKVKKEKPLPPITEKEKPFELPEGWKWCRLGEFADVKRGISPRYSENGISKMINQKCVRWFEVEVVHSRSIDKDWFESLDENRKTNFNDILVNSTGDGTIGRSAIVSQSDKGYGFDSHILRVRPYLDFISFYLAISINSIYGQGLIDDLKGAKSTKQTELGSSNLSRFSIPVPPLEEQKAIVLQVESLMEKCRTLEDEVIKSEQHAQMLIQAVLKEAFENRTDEAAEDTSHPAAKLSILPYRRGFAKLVLAGKIISECQEKKELTNIKFQKLQHLAEHLMEADLNLNYYNQAAGPYDPKFMHTVHRKLKDQKWFASLGSRFSHLEKSTEIDGYFNTFFGVKAAQFSKLCTLLGNASEAQCEIISTLYAVWNDRIIKGESTTSELLIEDFYNWSDRKHTYSTKQLQEAIQWMKEKGLEPTGFGYLIKHKKQK